MPTLPGGFYSASDVWINDIPLNTVDEDGNRWLVTDIDGWWSLPDPDVPEDARPFSDDGNYLAAGRYTARVITLTGAIVPTATNTPAAVNARNRLNRTLNMVRQTGVLRVDETESPKMARVQIVGRPLTKFNNVNGTLEYSIQFRAADPRKYALVENTDSTGLPAAVGGRAYNKNYNYTYGQSRGSGVIEINNTGSYTTYATLQIVGPVTNPIIEHVQSGSQLRFNIVLAVGDTLDINLRNKTVVLNGTASRRNALVGGSRWFVLDPGTNTINYYGIQHIPAVVSNPARTNLVENPALYTTPVGYGVELIAGPSVAYGQGVYGAGVYSAGNFNTSTQYFTTMGAIDQGYYRVNFTQSDALGSVNVGYTNMLAGAGQDYIGSMYVRQNNISQLSPRIQWYSDPSSDVRTNLVSTPNPAASEQDSAVVRRNYAIRPQPVAAGTYNYQTSGGEVGTTTLVSGATDGPLPGVSRYVRRSVTTAKTSGNTGFYSYTTAPATVSAGSTWVVAVYARSSASLPVRLSTSARTSGGAAVGSVVTTSSVTLQPGVWTRVEGSLLTASASADGIGWWLAQDSNSALPAGQTLDVTAVLVEQNAAGAYFDGATPSTSVTAYAWDAAEYASASTETTTVARWSARMGSGESGSVSYENATNDGPNGSTSFIRLTVDTPKTSGQTGIVYYESSSDLSGATGGTITASAYVRLSQTLSVVPRIDFLSSGRSVSTTLGNAVTVPANTWTRLSLTGTASSNFDGVSFSTLAGSSAVLPEGGTFDVAQLLVEGSNVLGEFFDGNSTNTDTVRHSWLDEPNDSPSFEITDVPGQLINTSVGTITSISTNTWTRLSVSATAPIEASSARLVVHAEGSAITSSAYLDIDNFLFEQKNQLFGYFDGRSPYATWTGSPDSSQSTIPEITGIPESVLYLTWRSAWID